MRSPSGRVLINRVDIYLSNPGRDADGGVQFPYPSSPTFAQESCTVQQTGVDEIEDQGRITKIFSYTIIFGRNLGLSPRDKIIYVDRGGVTHTIFAKADRDNAGRWAAFTVYAEERQ